MKRKPETPEEMEARIKRQIDGRAQKLKSKHPKLTKKTAKYITLDDMFDDLPDGAYFAAMEEHGYEAEDIIECHEAALKLGFFK